jgi:hypothetical protein
MKTIFQYNGTARLIMEPTSEVEILILKEMAEKAAQGAQATLKLEGQNQFVLTVLPSTKE